jgi:hypothetical protein
MNRNEMIQMACAEIGIEATPLRDTKGRFLLGWDTDANAVASRRAAALANLATGDQLMTCLTHRKSSRSKDCLLVTVTEVLRDPTMRCGAP